MESAQYTESPFDSDAVESSLRESVERCLDDIAADFERQGGLSMDDVYRLISARRLAPDDAAAVLTRLGDLKIPIDSDDRNSIDLDDGGSGGTFGNRLSSHRILSAAEEVSLGRRIRLGLDTQAAVGDQLPTLAETELIRDGREAHQTLVRSNVRLVISMARRYLGQGVELDDLIQEGVLGLMRAANKFDHTMGYKFSTYATWWVRQSIDRAIANSSRTIRLPVHVVEQVNRVLNVRRRMETVLGREPTLKELSFELEMDVPKICALLDYSRGIVSLDRLVGDDVTLGDLQAGLLVTPHARVERDILREDIAARLDVIEITEGERAAGILRRRFGFMDDGETQTLDEIGRIYGVTRERIRQIERRLLKSTFVRNLFSDLNEDWFDDDTD